MGCGASSPLREPDESGPADTNYPEEGKKLRKDATLEQIYDLGPVLGEGGFSKVRLVTNKFTGRQYACKVIPLPRPGKKLNEHLSDRGAIMKEIDALLDLDHPNVVCLKEYFVEKGRVYLIMELLKGGELLEAVLEKGHYSESDARTIFRQLILCLQYLHSKGVVHRDVKLDNLLLVNPGDIGRIKIADFGFARKLHGDQLDAMKTVCGTPEYIAPEVIEKLMTPHDKPLKNPTYGPPCDVWSAGIVLYMLLAGVPPFHDASEPRLLRAIMNGKYDFEDRVWKEVSPDAKDLIRRLLVVSPSKRITCEQVLEHPWMKAGKPAAGSERQLTRTRSRMLESREQSRKRSAGQASLQKRISDACSSTPAGGSPAGGSPTAAGMSPGAAAWQADSAPASPALPSLADAAAAAAAAQGAAGEAAAGGGGGDGANGSVPPPPPADAAAVVAAAAAAATGGSTEAQAPALLAAPPAEAAADAAGSSVQASQ